MDFPEDCGIAKWWQRTYLGYRERFVDDCVLELPGKKELRLAQDVSTNKGKPAKERGEEHDLDPSVTGTTVWDAGIVLAHFLAHTGELAQQQPPGERGAGSRRVVELGAGTGAVSLALAACGLAKEVVISDIPGVCAHLRKNVAKNCHLWQRGRLPADQPSVHVHVLRWGREGDVVTLPAPPPFDVVVGADLIYYADIPQGQLLFQALRALADKDTVVYLAVSLHHQPEKVVAFMEDAREEFEVVEHITSEVPEEYQGGSPPVVVIRMKGILHGVEPPPPPPPPPPPAPAEPAPEGAGGQGEGGGAGGGGEDAAEG